MAAGLDCAGGALPDVPWGAAVPGRVGMVCLRLGASGSTKGPFCPQPQRTPHAYIISPATTKRLMNSSITGGATGSAGTSPGGSES